MEEYQAPVQAPAPAKKAFFSKDNLPILIALAAAVVLVAALAVVLIVGSGPKAVAKRIVTSSMNADIEGWSKRSVIDTKEIWFDRYGGEDEFYEEMSDLYDEDIESWKDYCEVVKANNKENLEDEYGKYRITVEVTKVKELSVKKLKEAVCEKFGDGFFEYYEDYGLDEDKISKGAVVTAKAKIDGEDDDAKYVYTVYMVKIGASWKGLDWYLEKK